jgi:RNA polymerase sigma factor (sigma-70 family)
MLLTMSKTSRLPARSEHELVAAIRAGNDHAFEELYSRYSERIFGFIISKVHDHGRAEDIAQEVFMSALRRLRSSDQTIAFKPWIYEIAKNACIDEFRRSSRAREVPLEADGEFVVDRQKSSVSRVPTPAAAVESKQRLDDLRGAFGGLSATHHQLLVMREFEGMSYDEIGERLGMTRQMVESSLFRARRKLTEEYQELASGQRCEQIQTAIESGRLRVVSALGLRDRRRFARHLAHCQPCRHVALMAGVDETLLKPRSIAAKIAALLPFPLWRLPWRSRATAAGGSHQLAGAGSAGLASSAGSALTLGQAAATVAVIVAGAGGGLAVSGLASGGHGRHAATAHSAQHGSSASGVSGSSASAAALHKAAQGGAMLSAKPAALLSAGSQTSAARPGGAHGKRHASSSGSGTGSGGGSGSGGSGSTQGAAGSPPTVSGTASKVVNSINNTTDGLRQAAAGAGNTVSSVTNGVTNGVKTTVQNVTDGVSKTVNGVTGTVGKVTSTVGNAVNNATNGAVNPTQAVSGVNNTLNSVGSGVTNPASKVVNGATGTVTGTVQKVVSGVTGGGGSTTGTPSSSGSSGAGSATSSSGSGPLGGLLGGH